MKLLHEQIQYIEFLSEDFGKIKKFYQDAFGWEFTDYPPAPSKARQAGGPEYIAFSGTKVDGGFAKGEPVKGSVLVILYSEKLEDTKKKVEEAEGGIIKDIFEFPGGRRFEFEDPDGNRLAVWSDK